MVSRSALYSAQMGPLRMLDSGRRLYAVHHASLATRFEGRLYNRLGRCSWRRRDQPTSSSSAALLALREQERVEHLGLCDTEGSAASSKVQVECRAMKCAVVRSAKPPQCIANPRACHRWLGYRCGMVGVNDILGRGYFPKELPPPFTTQTFARHYAELSASEKAESHCLRYSYSKYAWVRRTLGIPNPAHMIHVAQSVSANWASIAQQCAKSAISHTKPELDAERAIVPKEGLDDVPLARAEIRTGARYIVKADVTSFYGTLYTHAIPWVFHTKAVAKARRNSKPTKRRPKPLFGNVIDEAFRNIQAGQTIGIPIGPDTSFAIAEAVLCEVDSLTSQRLKPMVPGFRFIDDYEFACSTLAEAERVRTVLQDSLAEYELQLNPRKTRIVELPDLLDTAWVHELASFPLESSKTEVQQAQVLRYMSRAFELVRQNPGEPILKYAVRRLAEVEFPQLGALIQKLLFQAAAVDPGTLHTALYVTYKQRQNGDAVDINALTRALSAIVLQHAPLQHGGDVAWALWGAMVFRVVFDDPVVAALEQLLDPIATLMALHAEQEGRLSRTLDKSSWTALMTPEELFEMRWLLVYEGVGQGWLTGQGGDPAVSDPFFADARAKKVSFYNAKAKKEIPPPSAAGDYA